MHKNVAEIEGKRPLGKRRHKRDADDKESNRTTL
jgi:hypothetical protein